MKTVFQKKLQFWDIWPRNRQKIAQIEVFVHCLDFASLVFLGFAHNDRWAWLFSYNSLVQSMYFIILDIPFIWWEIFNLKIKLVTISEQSDGDSEQFDGDSLDENLDEPQYWPPSLVDHWIWDQCKRWN